jgi:ABC-type antimicrobial peptide transport system permease subunit
VTAYTERRRSQEFGIRIALGAAKRDVLRQVLRRAMPSILIGEAVGLIAALACARLISGLLFGVEPSDPSAFLMVLLATTTAALLACLAPARRAGRIDPVQALRCE